MDRSEARELLTHVLMTYEPRDQYGDFDDSEPYEEAIDMAIEALDDNKCLKCLHNPEHPFTTNKSVNCSEKPTGKLNKRDDSLLTADSEERKEQKSKLDLISRADAIEQIQEWATNIRNPKMLVKDDAFYILESLPSAEPKTGRWIPIKWHEITDEEREREGYPKDWVVYIDCDMPSDGDEILVQTKSGYIRWDVCYEDGEFSLDSGWDWIEDIVAWMPLPEPYREDGEA